jgi:lipoate-protein ligase B
VNTDLSFFNLIIACDGEQVTSMEDLLGREVDMNQVEDRIVRRFSEVFSFDVITEPSAGPRSALGPVLCSS